MGDDNQNLNVNLNVSLNGDQQAKQGLDGIAASAQKLNQQIQALNQKQQNTIDGVLDLSAGGYNLADVYKALEKSTSAATASVQKQNSAVKAQEQQYSQAVKTLNKMELADEKLQKQQEASYTQAMKQARQAELEEERNARNAERRAAKEETAYKNRARSLREFSRWTGTVARDLAELSAVIMGPAILSSNAYTTSVGIMEQQSRDLINANDKLKVSWVNLGRAVAPELTHIQTITADILDSVARTAEQNPAATKTVLDVAAGLGAVSALGFVVRWAAQLLGGGTFLLGTAGRFLGLGAGAASAAGAAGATGSAAAGASAGITAAGGVAGIAAAVVPLAVGAVAAAGSVWLSSTIGNAIAQNPALQGASGVGKLTQGQLGAEFFVSPANPIGRMAALLGLIPGVTGHLFDFGSAADVAAGSLNNTASAANNAASAMNSIDDNLTAIAKGAGIVEGGQLNVSPAAKATLQFGIQSDRLWQDFRDSFTRMNDQANKAAEKAGRDYWKRLGEVNAQESKQAANAYASYIKARDRSDRDFNQQIAREQDDFNRQQERAAADHQKEIRRLEEDHRDRMFSLAEQRDALGIIREHKAFLKERDRSNADFSESQKERSDDFARQLEEQRKAHKQQQDDRWQDYQDQLAQIAAAAKQQRDEVWKNYQDQLGVIEDGRKDQAEQLQKNYDKQLALLKFNYGLQLIELGFFTAGMQTQWGGLMKDILEKKTIPFATDMTGEFQKMYDDIRGIFGLNGSTIGQPSNVPPGSTAPPPGGTGGMSWPLADHSRITQEPHAGHMALDISATRGTPIFSAKAGKVRFAGWSSVGYGNLTIVDHGGGLETYYAHQDHFADSAKAGASVSQGQLLGFADNTGNSYGDHLHFEVRQNGTTVNPRDYLRHVGGYTGDNWYRMQAGEYVLSRNTTAQLERMTGGPLSQGSVVGGARIGSLVLAQKYDGRIAAGDRLWIERMVVRTVETALSRAVRN